MQKTSGPLADRHEAKVLTDMTSPTVSCRHPGIQLYAMDCLDGMRQVMPDASVSVVVTSPPYNVKKPYDGYDDNRPPVDYLHWMATVAVEIERVLEPDGSLFLNVGNQATLPWLAADVAAQFRRCFTLQNNILWVKAIAIDKGDMGETHRKVGDLAVGQFSPQNSDRFLSPCYEPVFHFTKTGTVTLDKLAVGVPHGDKSNVRRRGKDHDLRDRGDVWFIPYVTRNGKPPHPAMFPVALPTQCLRLHGLSRICRVLDPFMGSGTTAVAAQGLGLPCVGFEQSPSYVRAAGVRLRGGENCQRALTFDGQSHAV